VRPPPAPHTHTLSLHDALPISQRLVRGVHPEILRRARQVAHHQADRADGQDQHGDGPVQELADATAAFDVLQAHGWTLSSPEAGGKGAAVDGSERAVSASPVPPGSPGAAGRAPRTAPAAMRSSTWSPIIVGQASMP